jgi:hypothetical protein
MGPPNQHVDEKNAVAGWGWGGGPDKCGGGSCPASRPGTPGPAGDVAGKTAPHKPRQNNATGGEPPGVSNIMEVGKNILSEFEGDNWAESARGNVASQALSACLAESQF